INLAGWHLTDELDNPDKWTFPSLAQSVLDPGEFLIVFASGQLVENYVDPAGYLHTDFSLGADGEYLALTNANNEVVDAYAPQFPAQRRDVSYGVIENSTTITLIGPSQTARAIVPTTGALDPSSPGAVPAWTLPAFDDGAWPASSGGPGVGFDLGDSPPPNI